MKTKATKKSKMSARVLNEFSEVLLRVISEFRVDGRQPTAQEKKYVLRVIKQSPQFDAIAKMVQRGTDSDLRAEQLLRKQTLPEARKLLLEAAKRLPHAPGGRKKSLTDDQKVKACRNIGELMGNGALLKDAVERVAVSLGVSRRTIYRAWEERANYNK